MENSGPHDLVAIFHSSFHVTKGNEIDWSLKSYPELSLEGIEFSTLPSGLHTLADDVLYFTQQGHHGVCVFRRRETSDEGLRGARMGALGVLVAKSDDPTPWVHVKALGLLADQIDVADNVRCPLAISRHFDTHKSPTIVRVVDPIDLHADPSLRQRLSDTQDPVHTLPDLFATFGPTSLTLFKHILVQNRVVIYTHPSAELACRYAVAALQLCATSVSDSIAFLAGYDALGMVGLFDIDRLQERTKAGRGWIACTTDRLFLEKPHLYDLIIDLSTPPSEPTRPVLFTSIPISNPARGTPTHRLLRVRFTFSDLHEWSYVQQILGVSPSSPPSSTSPPTSSTTSPQAATKPPRRDGIIPDWTEYLWVALARFWRALRAAPGTGTRIRLGGVERPLGGRSLPVTSDERADHPGTDDEHEHEHEEVPASPTSAVLLLDRGNREASGSGEQEEQRGRSVEAVQRYIAALDQCATSFSLSSSPSAPSSAPSTPASSSEPSSAPTVSLLPHDIDTFGLNPFSSGDIAFVQAFVESCLRRRGGGDVVVVQVSRPWRDMLGWLVGWSS